MEEVQQKAEFLEKINKEFTENKEENDVSDNLHIIQLGKRKTRKHNYKKMEGSPTRKVMFDLNNS